MFSDAFASERCDFDSEPGEIGYVITGMVNEVILTVVYTERGERIQIISQEKQRNMSKPNTIVAKRRSDGAIVRVLPDGSTMPLARQHGLGAPAGNDRRRGHGRCDQRSGRAANHARPSSAAPAGCRAPKRCAAPSP